MLNRTMTDSETQVNMPADFGPPFAAHPSLYARVIEMPLAAGETRI